MSWGSKPPFASGLLAGWLDEAFPGQARALEVAEFNAPAGIVAVGGLPEGVVCSAELMEKAREFLSGHRDRLDAGGK